VRDEVILPEAKAPTGSRRLADWLGYISVLHPAAWDLGLDRVGEVYNRLGLAPVAPHIFMVAGTNGKGSVCHCIAAGAQALGQSVGLATSPHFVRFNERIRINDMQASDADIVGALETIEFTRGDVSLTYFEFATLASLLIFKRRGVECAILEVGLGGRLDAMNVVDADVSIITRIGLDHQVYLGETLEQIGAEKAAIARRGRPAIIGAKAITDSVPLLIDEIGAKPFARGQHFDLDQSDTCWAFRGTDAGGQAWAIDRLATPSLHPDNVAVALQALLAMGWHPSREHVERMLEVSLPGRFQRLEEGRHDFILDVAHNPDAARLLRSRLLDDAPRAAVFGVFDDKDVDGIIDLLADSVSSWYVCTAPGSRGVAAQDLATQLQRHGADVSGAYDKVVDALLAACADNDRLLIFGSFTVVGAVLHHLDQHE
jgi:dihydrofolate synthase/folylpolyglutamate synthase